MGLCGVWIFSSELPSLKTNLTSSIKQTFQGKAGFLLSLVTWYSLGLACTEGIGGRGGAKWEMFCVCIVHAIALMNDAVWFGLFPPLLLILCVLFPLCCTIRTLQWDADPSVLQLQSDSELGYMSALLSLLWSFLCYSCVEMLELLLLLFPPFRWTSSLISLFPSVCFLKLSFGESPSLWKIPQKGGFWSPLLNSYYCKTTLPSLKKYKHVPTPLFRGGAHKFCNGKYVWVYPNHPPPLLTSVLKLIFVKISIKMLCLFGFFSFLLFWTLTISI